MKYCFVVVFLLLQVPVDAQAGESLAKRVKSKIENGTVINKVQLQHEMIDQKTAKKLNRKESYLSHIKIKSNKHIVYNLETSPYVSKNPILFFNFEDKGNEISTSINIILTNHMGIKKEQKFKINRNGKASENMLPINNIKVTKTKQSKRNDAIWEATNIKNAIEQVYGKKNLQYKTVKSNQITYTQFIANANIKSDEALESISIFSNTNPKATIAIFHVPDAMKTVDYKLNFTTQRDGELIIIAKTRKGEFYKAIYQMKDVNSDGANPRLSFIIKKDGQLKASTSDYGY